MDRRTFIKGASFAAGTGIATSALAKPFIAKGILELRMVTCWPKDFPGLGEGAQRIADRIFQNSGGRILIKVYGAGQLVPAQESFDAVAGGSADLYHGADYYWHDKHKAYNYFASVPFGMTADEFNAWVRFGGGQQLWDELGVAYGVKHMMAGNTGQQLAGWFTRPINSAQDLIGLRMRIPGISGEVLRRLGGSAVTIAADELALAMKTGGLDAAEWIGPWSDMRLGLHKVAKYCYYPGFHEPGSARSLGINLSLWEGLSKEDRAIIQGAADAENDVMLGQFNWHNAQALSQLAKYSGVTMMEMPQDVMDAFSVMAREVLLDISSESELSRRIHMSYFAARDNMERWSATSYLPYMAARMKANS
ncbi:TRAP transporter substrate-binding protein [Rhodobacteraceae bacterium RKSG542]|uniref:TRAP transporter substrate-binding protein n=1 Tax=Pseudovibrio flavus TaxID=2529854 RepID=UPI0012BB79A1|nr:TRAP transporter substrate-binding protein [Pseudovibrio flavus]MTI18673.1 TRAP transporter substrate-binding protein [Pseudovibrio flavus]